MLDHDKVISYKKFLAKSAGRLVARDSVKDRLEKQLAALQKVSSPDVRLQIEQLKRQIAETQDREARLMQHQQSESDFHKKMQSKIDALSKRLEGFLATREARLRRIAELEQKIEQRVATKGEKVHALEQEIARLEHLSRAISAKPQEAKQLKQIKQRIGQAKGKLREQY